MNHYTTIEQIKDDVNAEIVIYYKSLIYFLRIDRDGDIVISCSQNASQELLSDSHNPKDFFNTKATL
jgi:hypothetical protein